MSVFFNFIDNFCACDIFESSFIFLDQLNFCAMFKPREMEGPFDSMPRAVFVSERVKKKYWGEDEEKEPEKDKQ